MPAGWIVTALFFMLQPGHIVAQTGSILLQNERREPVMIASNATSSHLQLAFDELQFFEIQTPGGIFTELIIPGGYSAGQTGEPKLPAQKKLIEIPFGASVEVNITSYTTTEYNLSDYGIRHPLMPVQPSPPKNLYATDIPFVYVPEVYSKRSYHAMELASVEILGVLRGQRLARLTLAPVQYNPAEHRIRVYNNIELELEYKGADIELTNHMRAATFSPFFEPIYNRSINALPAESVLENHPGLTAVPVKMIIVSHPDFEPVLQDFIEWKTMQGFDVIEAYTDETGTSREEIKQFIHDLYHAATPEDPAPSFLLLVGDNDKLPASATGARTNQVTDLYYASADGDHFPDMLYGRLSARNQQELRNQIDKILYYQQYSFSDPSYLNDVTLIAGADSYWNPAIGQPTILYGTENYFNAVNGFANVNAYLTNYSGCYDDERIAVSLINYTAHCSPTSWNNPSLNAGQIGSMANEGKYPLAIGNCCESAQFSHTESIGEAWVRAENSGAVAYIGSVPNTHWFEDFYWTVGAFPVQGNNLGYIPSVEETSTGVYDFAFSPGYNVVSSIKVLGNLAITEAHLQGYNTHSNVQYYWEAYHTLGDPTTVIYLTEGKEPEVNHMPVVSLGLDHFTVETSPGAYIGLSKDGVLLGAAFADEAGKANVPITPVTAGEMVNIVVTKPRHIPYIEQLPVTRLDGSLVVLDDFTIKSASGSRKVIYNEDFSIDLSLKNVGSLSSGIVTVTLSGNDQYISIENEGTIIEVDPIQPGDTLNTATLADAFSFIVCREVPDQHRADFYVHIHDGDQEWTSRMILTANAPVFSVSPGYTVDDSTDGNDDGLLQPGEHALIAFRISNHGNATAVRPEATLNGDSPYFAIAENKQVSDPLLPGESTEVTWKVKAHPSALGGTVVTLDLCVRDGHADQVTAPLLIGQRPNIVIGTGEDESHQYPFYNLYMANRTQLLYLSGELPGTKQAIEQIAFDVTRASAEWNVFPNFVIRMMHTGEEELSEFIDTSDAKEVFSTAGGYSMTRDTGWHSWELEEHFPYDGKQNLLVEIEWGLMDDWTVNHYRLASTEMDSQLVAYGYSDFVSPPDFNNTSSIRPNIRLAFKPEKAGTEQPVHFEVRDHRHLSLENATITIGSLSRNTGSGGQTSFDLLPGTYHFTAEKEDYLPFTHSVTHQVEDTVHIKMVPENSYFLTFHIAGQDGQAIDDATITIDGVDNEPGHYSVELVPGFYSYRISKVCYKSIEGHIDLVNDHTIDLVLDPSGSGDANGDGQVDHMDVVAITDYLQEKDPNPFCFDNADVNNDYMVDILDVTGIINIYTFDELHPFPETTSLESTITMHRDGVSLSGDGTLTGLQLYFDGIDVLEITKNNDLPHHQVVPFQNGLLKGALIYSEENTPFPPGTIQLFGFSEQDDLPSWGKVIAANINAEKAPVETRYDDDTNTETISSPGYFRAFPNPARDLLQVQFNNLNGKTTVFSLINMHGQTIKSGQVQNQDTGTRSFSLHGLPAGLYLIRMEHQKAIKVRKVIVE